jgi:hypothetical protein
MNGWNSTSARLFSTPRVLWFYAVATKVMYRGVSAGIIISVTTLYIYDLNIPEFNYGPAIDSLNLICVILLVVGSEIYHRVSLQDASFETVYPEIESYFDDASE